MSKDPFTTCKVCGGKMAKNAKACPHCGAPNKKPLYKRASFWLGLAALGSGFAAYQYASKLASDRKFREELIKKLILHK